MTLSRDEFRTRLKNRSKPITIPEVGEVRIRPFSESELKKQRDKGKKVQGDEGETEQWAAKLIASAVVDDDNQPMFESPAEVCDMLSMGDIEYVLNEILEYSGVQSSEKTAKNSGSPSSNGASSESLDGQESRPTISATR